MKGKKTVFFTLAGMLCLSSRTGAQTKIPLGSDGAGMHWQLKAAEEVGKDSVRMYQPGYDTKGWVQAVVPGIVFQSYVAAGLEKDPNYADNIYRVDKQKYDRDFWYRLEFASPTVEAGKKVWLNFNGINRRGEIFFNGVRLGKLDGFMDRGHYDITDLLSRTGKNVLAVLVDFSGRPIPNHASPTYISSDGWDWMPPVPGLLNGITDEVYLRINGGVDIVDPWVRTDLGLKRSTVMAADQPAPAAAALSVAMQVENHTGQVQDGMVEGVIEPGAVHFSRKLRLGPGQRETVVFDTAWYKELLIHDPLLWWPNGYGKPDLYTCALTFRVGDKVSDERTVRFGIRQYTYDTVGNVLHIHVNGRRVFVKGGNWGMSEYMLRCRGAEYDWKVKLHREMHFNMIRNWIGSTTDEAFYDACDQYGIMVWDDFWLNSHPNLPDDVFAFNHNAVEKITRMRNHPAIAVWCGDNEGYPLPPLNGWLGEDVRTFDAGDRLYQPNSHADALTGSGPWTNLDPSWYFTKYPGGFGGDPGWGFRTEIGTAVFTTYESFRKFMPDSSLWPRNDMWDKHFFGKSAGNGGPDRYDETIRKEYGQARGIEDYCRKAQLVNIETNKALYEGWQHHLWNDASGVMTWMSQSAYPSLVWQTYDYYYDLTGAYWGVRKACEPLHIQWSYADNTVKVVNTTSGDQHELTAEAVVYDLQGKPLKGMTYTAVVEAPSNTATDCFALNFGGDKLPPVQFIRLSLKDAAGHVVSDNFYWHSRGQYDYTALNRLGKARLDVRSRLVHQGEKAEIGVTVTNKGKTVAFAIHVQALRTVDGERLLPALMDDNYFTLLPGETKQVRIGFDETLLKGGSYKVVADAYNNQ